MLAGGCQIGKSTACGQKSGLPKTSSERGSGDRGCNSNRKSGTTNTQQHGPERQQPPPGVGAPDCFLPPQPPDSESGSLSSEQPEGAQADSAFSAPQTTTQPLASLPHLSSPEDEMQATKASIAEKRKVKRIMRFVPKASLAGKATPEGKMACSPGGRRATVFNISLFALPNSEAIGTTADLRLSFAAPTWIFANRPTNRLSD